MGLVIFKYIESPYELTPQTASQLSLSIPILAKDCQNQYYSRILMISSADICMMSPSPFTAMS